jgi:hypothetical protein
LLLTGGIVIAPTGICMLVVGSGQGSYAAEPVIVGVLLLLSGRKDWRIMLYGAAFDMIVTDQVPPHIVQSILMMAIHGVAHILGVGGPPPSIAPQTL